MSDYYPPESFDDLPLFTPKEAQATRRQHEVSDETKQRRKSKNKQLISILEDGGWYSTKFLVDTVGHRFSTNIQALRERGYVIEKRGCDNSTQLEYKLVGKVAVVQVTPTWKERYYASSHWIRCSRQRREYDGERCCDCKKAYDLHVHHWRYDLFEEHLCDLMTLCINCHNRIHECVTICFPKSVRRDLLDKV